MPSGLEKNIRAVVIAKGVQQPAHAIVLIHVFAFGKKPV
jgi:hypothetical protein